MERALWGTVGIVNGRRVYSLMGKVKQNQATPTVVGIGWYTLKEWEKLRAIADDKDVLDETYKEWLQQAKHTSRVLRQKGVQVVKVYVDSEELAIWCAAQELAVDGEARARFVSAKLQGEISSAGDLSRE